MGYKREVVFHGGPKDGVTTRVLAGTGGLPKVLVFQGLIDGRFQIVHYHLREGTVSYDFDERRTVRDTVRHALGG